MERPRMVRKEQGRGLVLLVALALPLLAFLAFWWRMDPERSASAREAARLQGTSESPEPGSRPSSPREASAAPELTRLDGMRREGDGPAAEPSNPAPVQVLRKKAAVVWLRETFPERLASLSSEEILSLEDLDFHGKDVADEDLARLAALEGLRRLGLRGTSITDAGIGALSELQKLESLDLRDTRVSGACLRWLPSAALAGLDLTGTQCSGEDLAYLPPMPRLALLKLNSIALTDTAIESLAIYPALRHVELDRTALTDAGLQRLLERNPRLSRVEARGTRVTEAGVARLLALHPDLEIVFQDPPFLGR